MGLDRRQGSCMAKRKITVTVDEELAETLDESTSSVVNQPM